jgi:hypothetical protein
VAFLESELDERISNIEFITVYCIFDFDLLIESNLSFYVKFKSTEEVWRLTKCLLKENLRLGFIFYLCPSSPKLFVFISLFMHDRSTFPDNPLIFDEMRRRDQKTWWKEKMGWVEMGVMSTGGDFFFKI